MGNLLDILAGTKARLRTARTEQRIARLVDQLHSPSAMKRADAVVALGQTGDRRAVTPVIAALQDPDALVRYFATLALQRITGHEVIEPLLTAVASETDPYNRLYMVLELLRRGEARGIDDVITDIAAVADEGNHDFDDAPGIAAAIADLGEPALGHLINALNHSNRTVRWIAVMALGEMRDTGATELLMHAVHDDDSLVREEAAHVLEKLGGR